MSADTPFWHNFNLSRDNLKYADFIGCVEKLTLENFLANSLVDRIWSHSIGQQWDINI